MAEQKQNIGSEAGHWYANGQLVNEVTSADGKRTVKPSIIHARRLGLLPSVSAILSVLPAPELEGWKCKQYALAAETTPRTEGEEDGDWIARVRERFEANNQQAQIGTDWHRDIQVGYQSVMDGKPLEKGKPESEAINFLINKFSGASAFYLERPFSNYELGFGGTVDFYAEDAENIWVVDYKTTSDDKVESVRFYPPKKHLMQLSAYIHGCGFGEDLLCDNPKSKNWHVANLYIGREHGKIRWWEYDLDEMNEAYEKFLQCQTFWIAIKDYNPIKKS